MPPCVATAGARPSAARRSVGLERLDDAVAADCDQDAHSEHGGDQQSEVAERLGLGDVAGDEDPVVDADQQGGDEADRCAQKRNGRAGEEALGEAQVVLV
jgi:hypothetical protein